MIEEDKSLVEKKENIFKRIINKIKALFNKKENLSELPQNEAKEEIEIIDFDKFENPKLNEVSNAIPQEAEDKYNEIKARFFEKYNSYKKGELSSKSLSARELLMANSMLEKELEINKEESIKNTRELNELEEEISVLEKKVNINS